MQQDAKLSEPELEMLLQLMALCYLRDNQLEPCCTTMEITHKMQGRDTPIYLENLLNKKFQMRLLLVLHAAYPAASGHKMCQTIVATDHRAQDWYIICAHRATT